MYRVHCVQCGERLEVSRCVDLCPLCEPGAGSGIVSLQVEPPWRLDSFDGSHLRLVTSGLVAPPPRISYAWR